MTEAQEGLLELQTFLQGPNKYLDLQNEILRESFDGLLFGCKTDRTKEQEAFLKAFGLVVYDVEHVLALVRKIDWMTDLVSNDELGRDDWQAYVETDIHSFHVELRSLFDAIAETCGTIAKKKGQLPQTSFDALRNDLISKPKRIPQLLSMDVCDLIKHADWFTHLRSHRDNIVHNRRDAWVNLNKTKQVVFRMQIGTGDLTYSGLEAFLTEEREDYQDEGEGMQWILFKPYAGYYIGRMLHLLDRFSEILIRDLQIKILSQKPYPAPGLDEARAYIKDAMSKL